MARKFSLVEQYTKSFCNVPENILIPYSHTDGFLGLNPQPLRKIQFRLTYIPLKILAFKPPPPPSQNFQWPLWWGYGYFLEPHIVLPPGFTCMLLHSIHKELKMLTL